LTKVNVARFSYLTKNGMCTVQIIVVIALNYETLICWSWMQCVESSNLCLSKGKRAIA